MRLSHHHTTQIRRKLEHRLFFAKPKFCFTLMDIAVSLFAKAFEYLHDQ